MNFSSKLVFSITKNRRQARTFLFAKTNFNVFEYDGTRSYKKTEARSYRVNKTRNIRYFGKFILGEIRIKQANGINIRVMNASI
jgi:hypothetical protein